MTRRDSTRAWRWSASSGLSPPTGRSVVETYAEKLTELGKQIDRLVYDEALSVFLCCPMALIAVNRYVKFTGHAATLELAETEITREHRSRR
jgi:peptide/nickel transport system substrate-binding protein